MFRRWRFGNLFPYHRLCVAVFKQGRKFVGECFIFLEFLRGWSGNRCDSWYYWSFKDRRWLLLLLWDSGLLHWWWLWLLWNLWHRHFLQFIVCRHVLIITVFSIGWGSHFHRLVHGLLHLLRSEHGLFRGVFKVCFTVLHCDTSISSGGGLWWLLDRLLLDRLLLNWFLLLLLLVLSTSEVLLRSNYALIRKCVLADEHRNTYCHVLIVEDVDIYGLGWLDAIVSVVGFRLL